MIPYLRRLPGPVWTMALWAAAALVSAVLEGTVLEGGAGAQRWWLASAIFEALVLVACLVLGDRTPTWFLRAVLVLRLLWIVANGLVTSGPDPWLTSTLTAVLVVAYAGFWWRGRIVYLYAAGASLALLTPAYSYALDGAPVQGWILLVVLLFLIAAGLTSLTTWADTRARQDPMTGLPNRAWLDDYMRLQGRAGRAILPRTLVVLDLDHLAEVNDREGRSAGDAVLAACARAWNAGLRSDDVAVRVGGDEFVLILPQTDVAGARILMARLRDSSPHPISYGVVDWPADTSFDNAYAVADKLMYNYKRARRLND